MRTHVFHEYLRKNEKKVKPFLPAHMGPRSNLFREKFGQKSRDTVPLKTLPGPHINRFRELFSFSGDNRKIACQQLGAHEIFENIK